MTNEPPARCPAFVEDVSAEGIRLRAAHRYQIGSALEILVADQLWLGEIVWRCEAGDGFIFGVSVVQRISRLSDLERLGRNLVSDSAFSRDAQSVSG